MNLKLFTMTAVLALSTLAAQAVDDGGNAQVTSIWNAANVVLPSSQWTPARTWQAQTMVFNTGRRYTDADYNKVWDTPPMDAVGHAWYEPGYELTNGEQTWQLQTSPFSSDEYYKDNYKLTIDMKKVESYTGSKFEDTGGSGKLGYPTRFRSISAGYPNYSSGRYHGGVDFPCKTGTSVCAAESGTVVTAKEINYSYGYHIIIDHGNGLSTLYAHNSRLLVKVGAKVKRGQVIAKSGSTGNSTGPHCHFEVRVNNIRVNPMNYL